MAKKDKGNIYLVKPREVVKKKALPSYNRTKGTKRNNDRLVMVTESSDKDNKVKISKITSKVPSKENQIKGTHSKLKYTKLKKKSYVETKKISRSEHTSNDFEVSKAPLTRLIGKADSRDLIKNDKARIRNNRYNKNKKKKATKK